MEGLLARQGLTSLRAVHAVLSTVAVAATRTTAQTIVSPQPD
ncbi:MAG: hypothetical protein AB7V19_00750 [Candidatus Bipolaricaulia bacterium]